jgi:hypothetical protein
MSDFVRLIWCALIGFFRPRSALVAEILVLRHQLNVLQRKSPKRADLVSIDRLLLVGLYRLAPAVLDALKIIRPATWSSRAAVDGCHCASECGMDSPSIDQGMRVAAGAALHHSRPRSRLRTSLSQAAASDGHSRSTDCRTIALAERMCGAADRIDPAGLPRPCGCVWRAAPSAFAQGVSKILQRGAHALITGEGCADLSRRPGRRPDLGRACLGRVAPSICPSVSFRQGQGISPAGPGPAAGRCCDASQNRGFMAASALRR